MTKQLLVPAAYRMTALFVFWLALADWTAADIAAGVLAASLAAWASLSLLPPRPRVSRSMPALLQLVLRFPGQSLAAGWDVARRALDPSLPLRLGFVTCRLDIEDETDRNAFRAFMSLQPGSLPAGEQDDRTVLIHCLDTGQPIEAGWRENEALFARAVGAAHG